ncbi:MAG TPA: coniferyl aldehyde dehydrogenase [Usitatibacteraceae bacterium]|nr:coniferyl aldehyde dehydrogenase [Usitatibacteraceae bacterium]
MLLRALLFCVHIRTPAQGNVMDLSSPPASSTDLETRFAHARAAYQAQRMPGKEVRQARLRALERLVLEQMPAIESAISADFGHRSVHETRLLEVFPALTAIRGARRHVGRWMKPRRSWASLWFLPARNELRPQPLGVVGIVVPWNYPLLLALSPLSGALAAGNQVLIKMSEFTPQTGQVLEGLFRQYFPDGSVQAVLGGPDTARAFCHLPFDHLLFTGSTAVGREVMRAAAENLTPVTLELGGKSPAIVGPECRIDEAADKILFGKCLNAGQTCIAPDYVLVPRAQEQAFAEAAQRSVARLYPTLATNPDYSAVINARHRARLQGYLDDAAARGARVAVLNPAGESFEGTGKVPPALVANVNDSMRLMQDEIFGPILPLVPYDTLDGAIAYVNARPRPLALYYFGNFDDHVRKVLDSTVCGGVTVNETILHISQESLPFGGVGPSGMGVYHGERGFETFSKIKPVFHQSPVNGLGLFKPPYGRRFERLLKILLK